MDERIARDVVHMLLIDEAAVPMSVVQIRTGVPQDHLRRIIEKYGHIFQVIDGQKDLHVKLRVPIGICAMHTSKNTHCQGPHTCTGLHICKFYILSGSCRFGNKCTFGHDLSTSHNVSLLQQYLLDHIPIADLKKLFRKSRSRTVSTMPKICKFYNVQQGCRYLEKGKICPSIHICKYYIHGKCTFAAKCKRNHDIFDGGVKDILEKHGFDMHRTAKEILADLRDAQDCADDDDKDEPEVYVNERGAAASARPVPAPKPQLVKTPDVKPKPRLIAASTAVHPSPARLIAASTAVHPSPARLIAASTAVHPSPARLIAASTAVHPSPARLIAGSTAVHPSPARLIAASTAVHPSPATQTTLEDSRNPDICIYNLQGRCQFGPKCHNIHCDSTYQWQFREGDTATFKSNWRNFGATENMEVELTYSDAFNLEFCTKVENELVLMKFHTMLGTTSSGRQFEFRRLSTISGGEVEGLPLATQWRWYWLNQLDTWIEYGDKDGSEYKSNLTSSDLELKYLANPTGQIEFITVGYEYNLDFRRMVQRNLQYKTERKVCRRPLFVSADDIELKKKARRVGPVEVANAAGNKLPALMSLPRHWNVAADCDAYKHFQIVEIKKDFPSTMTEFKTTAALFYQTMPSTAIITSISRVENGELWLNYVSKKERMKKKNGNKDVDEQRLFHGTRSQYLDAICLQGFDFRLSGQTSGTRYGKGSYFALNAKYSDCYTEQQNRMMFVVKVLVGEIVKGKSSYVRPPQKDQSDPCSPLYDSCVDDEKNPSIFVIFEFNQVSPEYLIRYDMQY